MHVSRGLSRGENLYPGTLGGDYSGADCQKVTNSINFLRKSRIDHDFLVGRPYIRRPIPTPSPLAPGKVEAHFCVVWRGEGDRSGVGLSPKHGSGQDRPGQAVLHEKQAGTGVEAPSYTPIVFCFHLNTRQHFVALSIPNGALFPS
jgi:hypothetical protein